VDKMAATKMLHIRIDDDIKTQADETLAAMGLSMSEAVRLFLHRVVAEQALPFEVKVPNARTRAAMNEADEIVRSRRARFKTSDALIADIEENSEK
jgi:DNA-damage-inducible protein J